MAEAFCAPPAIDCLRRGSTCSSRGTMFVGLRHETATHPVSGSGTSSGDRGEAVFRLARRRWPRGLLGETWLTVAVLEQVSVRDRTLSLSTPLDRSSRSIAAVCTAESLASTSGAGLAATEDWHLPAGIGALQCLAMWPGCCQRWQRTCPLLRRLLGHLPSLCRLSSRRSLTFWHLLQPFKDELHQWVLCCTRRWIDSWCRDHRPAVPLQAAHGLTDSVHLRTDNLHIWDSWTVVGPPPPGRQLGYSVSRAVSYPVDNATC